MLVESILLLVGHDGRALFGHDHLDLIHRGGRRNDGNRQQLAVRSGRSFRGVTEYCLGDKRPVLEPLKEDEVRKRREHQEGDPSWVRRIMSDRVAWTQTLNLSTDDPYRASRMMAATARYSDTLKQLAGVKAGGRQLEKPVCHFPGRILLRTLPDEVLLPDCINMSRVIRTADPERHGIELSLLRHVSPIEWDNIVLYGEYVLNRRLVRRTRSRP